VLVDSG